MGEFRDAVAAKYQQLYDEGYAATRDLVDRGLVADNNTVIGSRVDSLARNGLRDWLSGVEGIEEGPGQIIQVNRRLYNATGSRYRIPDVYIPGAGMIFDGTIAEKTSLLRQTIDFHNFSGGGNVMIIRPSQLQTATVQGSYGLFFP